MTEAAGLIRQPREELFLATGPYETPQEVQAVCADLPDLSAVQIHESGRRNYRPMLETALCADGQPRGLTAVATMTILNGDVDGNALMTLRSGNIASQPNVWGMFTARFEKPLADSDAVELLTPAVGSLPLFGVQDNEQHLFDVLHPDSWFGLPNTNRFRQILEAEDPLHAARSLTGLSPAEALGAIVVSPMTHRLGKLNLRQEIISGSIELVFAAEALRTGIAFNNITTGGNEFELLMMLSIYVIMKGAEHLTRDKLNQAAISDFLWGSQEDIARAIRTRNLKNLLPTSQSAEVCVRGECVRNGLEALERLRHIRLNKPGSLQQLIAARQSAPHDFA